MFGIVYLVATSSRYFVEIKWLSPLGERASRARKSGKIALRVNRLFKGRLL